MHLPLIRFTHRFATLLATASLFNNQRSLCLQLPLNPRAFSNLKRMRKWDLRGNPNQRMATKQFHCNVCQIGFDYRSKLLRHCKSRRHQLLEHRQKPTMYKESTLLSLYAETNDDTLDVGLIDVSHHIIIVVYMLRAFYTDLE